MDKIQYQKWFFAISSIVVLVIAFTTTTVYLNSLVFNDSKNITNIELPIAVDSLSMLEKFGDMSSNLLEYSHGESEEKEEFYVNLEQYNKFFSSLKEISLIEPSSQLHIDRLQKVTDDYVKSAEKIFTLFNPEVERWAIIEVDKIEHGIAAKLERYIENLKNSVLDKNIEKIYLLELIDEAGDMLSSLAEYVSGEIDEIEEFDNNYQEFNFFLEKLKLINYDKKELSRIIKLNNQFYQKSYNVFNTYNPTNKKTILKLIDDMEHNQFKELENILVILAENAVINKEKSISSIEKTINIAKYSSIVMALLTIILAFVILKNIYANFKHNMLAMKEKENEIKKVNESLEIRIEDRTKELTSAKIDAENASKSKSEFLSNMSHEIRTPLNAIIGFTEILAKSDLSDKNLKYIQTIKSSAQALTTLINDILDFSKIEAGKLEIKKVPTDIKSLVEDVENALYPKLKEKNLYYKTKINKNLPKLLYLDNSRLRQILFNIIGNAIKFTNQGLITVMIDYKNLDDDFIDLFIKIKDTGIGVKKENQERIFKAFEQQSDIDTKVTVGTGLGLAICSKLIKLMKGTITLDSIYGKGSTFLISLPNIKIAYYKDVHHLNISNNDLDFYNSKVVIADDIQNNITLITTYYEEKNITFLEAKNGKEVIELLEKEKPDLILMDLKMPVMNGYECCEYIRENSEFKEIPIIAISASVLDRDMRLLEKNFNGYLSKPIDFSILDKELSKFLKTVN